MSGKRIGIFGGSFDPPHLGHEALALAALEKLKLDELWIIPAGVPVHRELTPHVNAIQRLKWVRTMFEDQLRVRIVDWEVSQAAPVAAVETLRRFHDEVPDVVPLWICGADSYASMVTWVGYPEHRALCNVAVFRRAGEAEPKVHEGWNRVSHTDWMDGSETGPGHTVFINVELPDVSATMVRQKAAKAESLNGLVNSRISEEVGICYRAG